MGLGSLLVVGRRDNAGEEFLRYNTVKAGATRDT